MTAQSSHAERGPRPWGHGPPAAAESGPLDIFLRAEPPYWGVPQSVGGSGFAALRFDASPGSAARTRRFLRSTLTNWHLHELMDDAAAVAAELVANAVTHALRPAEPALPPVPVAAPEPGREPGPERGQREQGQARARAAARSPLPQGPRPAAATAWLALVRMDGAVVCAVADPSPELPEPVEPEPFAESGRGLHIVAELSDSWGHSAPAPAGKTVWARLACGDGGH